MRHKVMKSRVEVGVRNEVMGRGGGCAMKSWVEVGVRHEVMKSRVEVGGAQ